MKKVIVIIANKLPDALRGRLKLWFIEPRPNVFVSGIKDNVALKVIEELKNYCKSDSGLLIIRSIKKPPWYALSKIGKISSNIVLIDGIQLITSLT